MSFIHPEPPRIPPEAPQQHHDPDQWRHQDGKRGRRPVSTTHIFLGVVVLAVAASIAAFCFGSSGESGLEGAILSPEDGSLHSPGTVIVRIRAFGRDEPPRWELAYRATNRADDWTVIAEGNPTVSTFNVGTGGQVLEPVEILEHGVYELRLVVSDREGTEEIVETVQITVVE